jgi:hypothetical protein
MVAALLLLIKGPVKLKQLQMTPADAQIAGSEGERTRP